jgi:hypothetical protein
MSNMELDKAMQFSIAEVSTCILALTVGNPVFLISTKGARWV